MSLRRIALLSAVGLATSSASAQDINWNVPGGGSWNLAANWDPINVPDSAAERAIIALPGGYTITVASSVLVGQLLISNPAAIVQINNGQLLAITGPQFTNDGAIVVNPTAGGSGTNIRIDANLTLDGSGEVRLHAHPGNLDTATFNGSGALTQGPDHLIRGRGRIVNAAFINNGTVSADEDGLALTLQTTTTNNSLMNATSGGFLDISAGSMTQSGTGSLVADNGTVRFFSTTINGGTVTSAGTGVSMISASSVFNNVTVDGTFQINNGQLLGVGGAGLTHAGGTLTINPQGGGSGTNIRIDAPVLISGPGVIALNAHPANLDTATIFSTTSANIYTNGTGHTIRGVGRLAGVMVNNGIVNADVATRTLDVNANPATNIGLMTATNSGTLQFSSNGVTNTGGTIAANAGTVNFHSMGLTGGQVNITNAGIARVTASSTFTNVSVNGPFEINNGNLLAVAGSALTHTGTITVNPTAAGSGTNIRFDAPASLSGPGTVVLNAHPGNLDTATITSSLAANIYTNGPGHTIRGLGRLYGVMVNDGTVNADVSTRALDVYANPTTNHSLFTATNSGILQFVSTTVNNTGATIVANDGTVNFHSMGLTGGHVNTTNGGVARITGSSTFTDVTVNGALEINNGNLLAVAGSALTHTGTITVNPTAAGSGTNIRFDAPASLSGPGTVVLNAHPGNLDTATIISSTAANIYTNAAAHTIRGHGRLYGVMVNNGTVNADSPGVALDAFANPTTNNNLFTATNSGVLQFANNTVNNTNGLIVADAGTINFAAMGLTGGQVNSINGGVSRITGSSTFTNVVLNGPFEVNSGQILVLNGSGLTHTGTLTINPTAGGSGTSIRFDTSGSFSGTGSVVLNTHLGNFDTAIISATGTAVITNDQGHTIAGTGRIYSPFINNGIISPGNATDLTGRIERQDTYVAGVTSEILIDLDGIAQGSTYDHFRSTGAMTLDGTLTVRLAPGYIPPRNTAFTIITAPSVTGHFTTTNLPALPPSIGYARVQYLPNAVRVLIPLCPTDWNGMDGINSQDFFDFLSDFFANTADFNFDGFINSQDFFDFLISFFGGCPG